MATLKQCDRCKKTWDPAETTGYRNGNDKELCTLIINAPERERMAGPPTQYVSVNEALELCQLCIRLVIKLVRNANYALVEKADVGIPGK